jgi:heme A synthase
MSNAIADPSRASAAWIAVALVLSRYAGAAVAKYTAAGARRGAPRRAARAASTPMEVVSSS